MRDPSLVRFRAVVEGALSHLESRRREINDLNVFPVADGDTGDNMALTLSAVVEELDRLGSLGRPLDDIGRDEIVESVARAALLGARGNSGVILSQLIRGAAEELIARPGELVDPTIVGAAMARAATRAYESVAEPAEGTMLTVMREMAACIALELPKLQRARFGTDEVSAEEQNALVADVLEKALAVGEASVRRGPELLPALKQAGVVDSGGHAVTIIFAGVIAALRGTDAPVIEEYAPAARPSHPEHESSTFRFCTNFAVTGTGLDAAVFRPQLEALGDSVLVVGDARTLKVHVHTDEPERATGLFAAHGEVSHLDVADMRAQVVEREARLAAPVAVSQRCGCVAVCAGSGVASLFESLGVHVLDGGQTLNPSTMELLAAIHEVPAEEVVVLPNSANVIMAAERAAELSEKTVVVVPSRTLQGGLAAAVALAGDRSAAENAAAMAEALAAVRTGGVARAAREDPAGRFGIGDAVGYVEDELVAWGRPKETLASVLERLSEGAELITCLAGDDVPVPADEVRALVDAAVELELSPGGQPSWWWLLSAE